ncbi:hypothetical protein AOXY_G10881 [Acipenser oxyrinchus oxyrinchus]|uniref:Uncharacterized protein n=1 Tax=Acipenser oxyrinchus oxyrinchus TaxID=40147 RepID=A0AAD8DH45_ACIOX|nr:hypothetical protein AOXY_G10881 [Acipenser oxyrinchus oxyrinchus]
MKNEGQFDGDFLDKNLVIFCFLGIIQDKLDATVDVWNSHVIRPSKNDKVPHGRPSVMYSVPELYDTQDYLCGITPHGVNACKEDCTFRSTFACDEDVFRLCTLIVAERNLDIANEAYKALDLYQELKQVLSTLL